MIFSLKKGRDAGDDMKFPLKYPGGVRPEKTASSPRPSAPAAGAAESLLEPVHGIEGGLQLAELDRFQ